MLAAPLGNASVPEPPAGWISLRVLPNAQPQTLEFLARVAEPTSLTLPKPISVRDLIKASYGYYSDQLYKFFEQSNAVKSLPDEMVTGDVVLPVSPKFEFKKAFTIDQPDYFVSDLASAKMGSYGTNNRREIQKLNPGINLNKPMKGQTIILPYVAEPVVFKLKPAYAQQARQILASLDRAKGVFHTEQITGFSIIPYWVPSVAATESPVTQPLPADWWVKDVIGSASLDSRGTTVVAIVDSGITPDDERFKPLFWTNYKEARGADDEDNDNNGCYHDVIGCNFITRGFPADDLDLDSEFYHGTHVAGLASGRMLPDPMKSDLAKSIRLMILKVANEKGLIEPGRIHDAINYAHDEVAKIVNMSFEGDVAGASTRNLISSNPQILFVVAAGNGALDLEVEGNEVYPASLGKSLENVITVAASNEKRQLASFSNHGSRTVMIAAPGVDMDSTVDVDDQLHSGTSQATPLVTLAAALLNARGMVSPSDIKLRLFNTVTFVKGLDVRSEGILNIEKALAFDEDVVQLQSGEILKGKLETPVLTDTDGASVSLKDIESIVINHSTEGKRDRIWKLHKGVFAYSDTDLGDLVLKMTTASDKRELELKRGDISTITPAWTSP